MFLDGLARRNPALIEAATRLHQSGRLEPNTYVIDVDAVRENARFLVDEARRDGLVLYAMTKQYARHPAVTRAILEEGVHSTVAVDWMGARALHRAGLPVGHLGHLVQIPKAIVPEAVSMRPEVVTVFSLEAAAFLSRAAAAQGQDVGVLLRVIEPDDVYYRGHEGGFPLAEVLETARRIDALPGVHVEGVTAFPCMLYSEDKKDVVPTPNFTTVMKAVRLLRDAGFEIRQVNAPGTTSTGVLRRIAEMGGTHAEPGNGFTGTTPLSLLRDLPERPAIAYVTEVSHLYNGQAFVFGGGLYIDKVTGAYDVHALLVKPDGKTTRVRAELVPDASIDYYAILPDAPAQVGDTVVFGFRPQVFVTRAGVKALVGLSAGGPERAEIVE